MTKEDVIYWIGIALIVVLVIFGIVYDAYNPMDACMRAYHNYEYCQMKVGASE